MGLYSVLMVDDEDEVIGIIRRKINWEEMGFYVCGQARNGIEALEMVEEQLPDVVITDIKMPYMDGLTLSKNLKEKYPDIKIIVFSGFDEFDYVKQAIGLEVEEYLLKPVDSEEIRRVFNKTRKTLDEERDLQSDIEYLKNYYDRSLPLLRESFFSLIMEESISQRSMEEYLREYEITLVGPYYMVAIIHVSEQNVSQDMSANLLRLSVRKYVDDSFINNDKSYIFNFRQNIVVLTQLQREDEISKYTDDCDRFCKSAMRTLNAPVTIGIGKAVKNLSDISVSYGGAREALSYRALYGSGNAMNIEEIDPREGRLELQDREYLYEIFKMIKMGDEEKMSKAVDSYVDYLRDAKLSLSEYEILMMEMVTAWYRFISTNDIDETLIIESGKDTYSKLLSMESMEEVREWIKSTTLRAGEVFKNHRTSKTGSFVRRAITYIEDNYSNPDLNVDMVCQELSVSSAYFSTVFKKETGKTFVNYLTEVRMKEAERLLTLENEKNYIIAQKVGYSDPGYFSYVFKKYFGVSPMKYKKE